MAAKLIGLLLGLSAAKLWLGGTVPWFVGLGLLALSVWLVAGLPGLRRGDDGDAARDEGSNT
jgi:hypothetical protein